MIDEVRNPQTLHLGARQLSGIIKASDVAKKNGVFQLRVASTFVMEKNGRFLIPVMLRQDGDEVGAEEIESYTCLSSTGVFTVVIVWGVPPCAVHSLQVVHKGVVSRIAGCDIPALQSFTAKWWEWAKKAGHKAHDIRTPFVKHTVFKLGSGCFSEKSTESGDSVWGMRELFGVPNRRVYPSDVDVGFIINGALALLESKRDGEKLTRGQEITFTSLNAHPSTAAVLATGIPKEISDVRIYRNGTVRPAKRTSESLQADLLRELEDFINDCDSNTIQLNVGATVETEVIRRNMADINADE